MLVLTLLLLLLLLLLLVVGLNVVATVVVARRDGLTEGGRRVQQLLIWLLPLVGAIVCLGVATADGSNARDNPLAGGDAAAGHDGVLPGQGHPHSHADGGGDGGD